MLHWINCRKCSSVDEGKIKPPLVRICLFLNESSLYVLHLKLDDQDQYRRCAICGLKADLLNEEM
jgi:hypothetical protein